MLCAVCAPIGAALPPGNDPAALVLAGLTTAFDSGAPPDAVLATITDAKRQIVARSQAAERREAGSDHRWHGSGTTADVALFVAGRAHLAHVGDGCIYRFRSGRLESMTTAHTLVNEYRRLPEITDAQLARIPKNVIVRALGMTSDVEIDRAELDALSGDVWILCSGHLAARVSEESMTSTLLCHRDARAIRDELVLTHAVLAGGREDGLSIVVHAVGA